MITTTHPRDPRDAVDDPDAQHGAERPAEHADEQRLQQELRRDLGAAVPDGPPDPDFSRALNDRIDITLAIPIPPTVSASSPANRATSCSVRLACAAACSTLLGIWVDTWSGPPRLMAVGMAFAVAWVVPDTARMYS